MGLRNQGNAMSKSPNRRRRRTSAEKQLRARQLRRDQTAAEALLWEWLRNRQHDGYKFRCQHPIDRFIVPALLIKTAMSVPGRSDDGGLHPLAPRDCLSRTARGGRESWRVVAIDHPNLNPLVLRKFDRVPRPVGAARIAQFGVKCEHKLHSLLEHTLVQAFPGRTPEATIVLGVLCHPNNLHPELVPDLPRQGVNSGGIAVDEYAPGGQGRQLLPDALGIGPGSSPCD